MLPFACLIVSSFALTSCSKSSTKDVEVGKSWLIQKKGNKNDFISFWKDCLPSFSKMTTSGIIPTSPMRYFEHYLDDEISPRAFESWIFCEISLYISESCNGNKSYGIDCKDYGMDLVSQFKFKDNQLDIKMGSNNFSLRGKEIDIKYDTKWELSYTKDNNTFSNYFALFALCNTPNFS